MAGSLGKLVVDIAANTALFKTGLDETRKEMRSFRDTMKSGMQGIRNDATAAVSGFLAFQTVKTVFTGVVQETVKAEQATAKLNAVLHATGNAAGLTASQISDLSDELAENSLFDDDAIKDAAAVLATFRNIAGPTFREAMTAAVDLSTVMGQDLQSSVVQLGKALNDPLKGITALQKIGVSFSAQQKEQIKHFMEGGQVAKAQGVILQELAGEFGGAGAGSTGGLAGSIHIASMAYDDFLKSLGKTSTFRALVTETLQDWTNLFKAWSIESNSKNDPANQIAQQIVAFKREMWELQRFINKNEDDPSQKDDIAKKIKRMKELQVMIAVGQVELLNRRDQQQPKGGTTNGFQRTEDQTDAITKLIAKYREEADTVGMVNRELIAYNMHKLHATDAEIALAQKLEHTAAMWKAIQIEPGAMQNTTKKGMTVRGEMMRPDDPRTMARRAEQGKQWDFEAKAIAAREQSKRDAELWQNSWLSAIDATTQSFADFFQRAFTEGAKLRDFLKGLLASVANVFATTAANGLSKVLGTVAGLVPAPDNGVVLSRASGAGRGSAGTVVNVYQSNGFAIHAMDAPSVQRLLQRHQGDIMGLVGRGAREARAFGAA